MNISIELTFSLLQYAFKKQMINFIKKLRTSEFSFLENSLSAQVFGEYSKVTEVLNTKMETAFELMNNGLLFLKIVKLDWSTYESRF